MDELTLLEHHAVTGSYDLYEISDDDCETLFTHLKKFWIDRDARMTPSAIDALIDRYGAGRDAPYRTVPASMIADMATPVIEEGRTYTILELGCATGPLLQSLEQTNVYDHVQMVGIEPFGPFVKDFEKNFPTHTIFQNDAEGFIAMNPAVFKSAPYATFYASVTLCMLPPRLARACVAKAATLCDGILIYDYLANGMLDFGGAQNLIFPYSAETEQYYFAHNYPQYLSDLGFSKMDVIPVPRPEGIEGYGILRARRDK